MDLQSQLVHIEDKLILKNNGRASVESFIYCLPSQQAEKLAYLAVRHPPRREFPSWHFTMHNIAGAVYSLTPNSVRVPCISPRSRCWLVVDGNLDSHAGSPGLSPCGWDGVTHGQSPQLELLARAPIEHVFLWRTPLNVGADPAGHERAPEEPLLPHGAQRGPLP